MTGKKGQNREHNLGQKYKANGQCTTVMIRNIPTEYTQDDLIQEVIESMGSEDIFDFCYLPWDSQSSGNVGYVFINFHTNMLAQRAVRLFSGYRFRLHDSPRVAQVSSAHIQGLENNLRHLQDRAVVQGNLPCSPIVMWKGKKVEISTIFQELKTQDTLSKFRGQGFPPDAGEGRDWEAAAGSSAGSGEPSEGFGPEGPSRHSTSLITAGFESVLDRASTQRAAPARRPSAQDPIFNAIAAAAEGPQPSGPLSPPGSNRQQTARALQPLGPSAPSQRAHPLSLGGGDSMPGSLQAAPARNIGSCGSAGASPGQLPGHLLVNGGCSGAFSMPGRLPGVGGMPDTRHCDMAGSSGDHGTKPLAGEAAGHRVPQQPQNPLMNVRTMGGNDFFQDDDGPEVPAHYAQAPGTRAVAPRSAPSVGQQVGMINPPASAPVHSSASTLANRFGIISEQVRPMSSLGTRRGPQLTTVHDTSSGGTSEDHLSGSNRAGSASGWPRDFSAPPGLSPMTDLALGSGGGIAIPPGNRLSAPLSANGDPLSPSRQTPSLPAASAARGDGIQVLASASSASQPALQTIGGAMPPAASKLAPGSAMTEIHTSSGLSAGVTRTISVNSAPEDVLMKFLNKFGNVTTAS